MTSSMHYKLHSHPDLSLMDHLEQVQRTGLTTFRDNAIFPDDSELLKVILAFHDLGKGSAHFQDYLLKNGPRSNLTRHSEISALWACYYCIFSLNMDPLDALFAYVCVLSHHGSLGNILDLLCPGLNRSDLLEINDSMDYEELNRILAVLGINAGLSKSEFNSLLDYFAKNSLGKLYRMHKSKLTPYSWLRLDYLFSILIWADKYSAIFQDQAHDHAANMWKPEYLDAYKSLLPNGNGKIDQIRSEAYEILPQSLNLYSDLYSINMPTGSGKTLSSLKAALELRKLRPHLKRIIYCLPFTSVIDQNHSVFHDILVQNSIQPDSSLLLAHHHLADFNYQSQTEYSRNESEYLVETWDSELVVSTFVQLLSTCLSVKNSNLKRFHRLANAIILLDEVQNIPHHFWPLLKHTLTLVSSALNSVFILVTATLPMIFDPEESALTELASRSKEWFSALNRIELHHDEIDKCISMDILKQRIIRDHKEHPTLKRLIILNTVQNSLDLYESLVLSIPDADFVYLSSNVIPLHRLQSIEKIKKQSGKAMIIVSTQVVEAGVDIDVDVVYRDLAPLDSIIQAAGRCNRNAGKGISKVIVFQLAKEQSPYWRYIYDQTLVMGTLKVLMPMPNPLPESEFYTLSDNYYRHLNTVASQDRSAGIINSLSRLELDSALSYHPKENPEAFNLIDSHPVQTVFVEIDDEASNLYRRYQELKNTSFKDGFLQRAEIKDVLRKMGAYMINVDKRFAQSEEPILFVDRDSSSLYYDLTTGYKRKQAQADYIF